MSWPCQDIPSLPFKTLDTHHAKTQDGFKPCSDTAGDPDEWDKVLRVNMMAPMRLMRRLTPAMVEKGEGVVINIDSSAGLSPKPGNAVYSASK